MGVQITASPELQPAEDVSIKIPYLTADVGAFNESNLILARYNPESGTWVPLPSTVDTTNNTVTGRTNHLSIFQIMAAIPPSDTANVRAYPNPYRPSLGHTSISLVGLPADATISIYTLTGEVWK